MDEILPKDSVVILLKSAVPDWEWLLQRIESEDGWLRFPPLLNDAIRNLKIHNYPLLYENETALLGTFMLTFFTLDQIKEFNAEIEAASLEERGELVREFTADLDEACTEMNFSPSQEEKTEAVRLYEEMPLPERQELTRQMQYMVMSFLGLFYEYLSVMVHGEKLTSLVKQAKHGNDEALVKAVQIDHRTLTTIPYFLERHSRARNEVEPEFCEALAYRMKSPPFKGKLRYKSLWMTFAVLDQAKLLDLPRREILDICDEVGVGGFKNRIEDEGYLSKRIAQYRRFQERGIAMP